MTLTKYTEKRNFNESPEPVGGAPDSDRLRFVIQKHDASRLHYDFRLEMEGVLKSWAVPKGPSTDPSIKRLAMMVEDHPYDYRSFEGIIPSGYGAGTVIVWDEGFYELADAPKMDKKAQDKALLKGIQDGKLHVVLFGEKVKGQYALVKTTGRGENGWLIFKVKDEYVSKDDVTIQDKSVISNKTLQQMEEGETNTNMDHGRSVIHKSKSTHKNGKGVTSASAKVADNNKKINVSKIITNGKTAKCPATFAPMLATMLNKPFDKEGWQFEIKWDGFRTVAICDKHKVELKSRNDKSFNEKFYPIHKAIQQWNINAIVDGEVVVLDEDGKSDFGALQNWQSESDGNIYYYVFDVLWLNGKDLTQLPLSERRYILKQIVPVDKIIRLSENFEVSGIELFETVKEMGLEGIMAKNSDSVYAEGNRSREWLKIKANKSQEMVIGGYTKNEDTSKSFSALLLGVYEEGKLIYKGKVGTGFSDKQQIDMLKQFIPYLTKSPAFSELPDINKPTRFRSSTQKATAIWMKPELVCEVTFTEITKEGVMRHPSFKSMRTDKVAKETNLEEAIEINEITSAVKVSKKQNINKLTKMEKDLFLTPAVDEKVKKINGNDIKFTNLDKVYWPAEKITKRDMLNYYHQVAPYILPYLKDRPQSMNRHPNGIDGESFYFKDVTGTAPKWVETFEYKSYADDRVRNHLVAKDESSLLYMANLGCIEMNPWHSKVETEDFPDWCVIDLDPAENTFQQVIEAAIVTKDILEGMSVSSYPKTSGSTGIHIYIPLGAKYTYDQSKEFARVIATLVQREIPKYTSIERIIKSRKGKMYIDFLQNRPQATIAAPYSLRPKPGATVAMPLHWDEVKKGLKMSDFTIHNAMNRITSVGDIFKPVLGIGIDLQKVVENFNK